MSTVLTKVFDGVTYERALDSWQWIEGISGKRPVLASLFGAVFLQDQRGYWWLDPISAEFVHLAGDRASLQTLLESDQGQDEYLLGGLAMAKGRGGLGLAPNEIYSFTIPPALGGSFELDNIDATDFVVAVNLAGQMHEQIRDLPPGTRISGVTLDRGGS